MGKNLVIQSLAKASSVKFSNSVGGGGDSRSLGPDPPPLGPPPRPLSHPPASDRDTLPQYRLIRAEIHQF